MTIRLPNPRYIGDGVYIRHDGSQLFIETSDGITVQNRIGISAETLEGINNYREYLQEYYGNSQHQVTPNCEDCNRSLENPGSPIAGAVRGEVYRISQDDAYVEVRLCTECARVLDGPTLKAIVAKRPPA